jgi:sn-glycerol 3-phosphate transport system substrate-binding protein
MGERANVVAASGAECVFTVGWQSWTLIENFSAWRDIPFTTRGNGFGVLDTELIFNSPVHVKYILG